MSTDPIPSSSDTITEVLLGAIAKVFPGAYLIGPNPSSPRWMLVSTHGLIGHTLGKGETPQAAFDAAMGYMQPTGGA